MYIDDLFKKFHQHLPIYLTDSKDRAVLNSLLSSMESDLFLTKSQAGLTVKLLRKYTHVLDGLGVDYNKIIDDNKWSKAFRILDFSKKVWVEYIDKNYVFCIQFPFDYVAIFKEFLKTQNIKSSLYDRSKGYNVVGIYDINCIALLDFCNRYMFEIDDTFLDVVSYTEEVWNNEDSIVPYSYIDYGEVKLCNSTTDAIEYFDDNKKNNIEFDILLSAGMGYPLRIPTKNKSLVEKIASSTSNFFHCENIDDFFTVFKIVNDTTAIILDRHTDELTWLKEFVSSANQCGVERKNIKVCFRDSGTTALNTYIKQNHLGGKIDSGKIFIFRHKPAKWLCSKEISVKIVATNNLFSLSPHSAQLWLETHPFVFYLNPMSISVSKDKNIVEL